MSWFLDDVPRKLGVTVVTVGVFLNVLERFEMVVRCELAFIITIFFSCSKQRLLLNAVNRKASEERGILKMNK